MDLRGFEASVTTGNPVVGATVNVREANLLTPNVTAVLDTTTTDANGMWEFAGLSDTPKDIDITYLGQHWTYRGKTQVSVDQIYTADASSGTEPWPLIPNAGFESWISGVGPTTITTTPATVADTWTAVTGTGSTGSITREGTTKAAASDYSAKLIYARVAGVQRVYRILTAEQVSALRGKDLSVSMQYRQGVASNTRIFIEDSAATTYSATSATIGSFLTATAKQTIDAAATKVWVGVEQAASDTAYVDNFAILVGTPDAVYGPTAFGAGSIEDYLIGSRTPDQSLAAASGAQSPTSLWSMLANRVKAIAGTTNWYDAPASTIAALVTSVAAKLPLAGGTMTGTLAFASAQIITFISETGTKLQLASSSGYNLNVQANTLELETARDVAFHNIAASAGDYSFKVNTATHAATFQGAVAAASYTAGGNTVWHAGNDGAGSGLDADSLDGISSAGFATAAQAVPNGAVVWFETLAELTAAGASWQRYTSADGRLLVGAGASASSQTFTEATNYGADWTPANSVGISNTLGVNAGSLDVGGSLGVADAVFGAAGGGLGGATNTHSHPITNLTVTGSPALSGSVSLSGTGTVWTPYMRAGIWGRKI